VVGDCRIQSDAEAIGFHSQHHDAGEHAAMVGTSRVQERIGGLAKSIRLVAHAQPSKAGEIRMRERRAIRTRPPIQHGAVGLRVFASTIHQLLKLVSSHQAAAI
jgi:hypothetical protein